MLSFSWGNRKPFFTPSITHSALVYIHIQTTHKETFFSHDQIKKYFSLSTTIFALVYIHKSLKCTSKNDIYEENQVYAGELKNLIFLPSTTISAIVWHGS